MNKLRQINRALISVYDKDRLVELGAFLQSQGIDILSTGGSAQVLTRAGIPAKEVSDYTEFPEMMNGRVKTLHPKIHGGILAKRDNSEHVDAMNQQNIASIDLVVVNLYPFRETVASSADFEICIEIIDIGGPAMIRSAAKNHKFVTVVVDPNDYEEVMKQIDKHDGYTTAELRKRLAAKAFALTAQYDAAISEWFAQNNDG